MKTALVTGGSRGIGKGIALELGKSFNVVVGYSSSKDSGEEVVEEIVKSGGTASTVEINVTNIESIEKAFTAIEKEYGGVDVLVNNAGITKDNILPRLKEDDWNDVIDTNLSGSFRTSQRAIKHMMKSKWGRIVYISSIVGMMGNQGQANYAASKAGIIGMSKSLAIEYAKKNITINCVSPGFIQTKMTDNIAENIKAVLISKIPMAKLGKGEDVSNTVAFLCSEAASYITGETIHVNGGMYMA